MNSEGATLFLVVDSASDAFGFIVTVLRSRLFGLLYSGTSSRCNNGLPIRIHYLLSRFTGVKRVPRFRGLVTAVHDQRVSTSVVLRSRDRLGTVCGSTTRVVLSGTSDALFLKKHKGGTGSVSRGLKHRAVSDFGASRGHNARISRNLGCRGLKGRLVARSRVTIVSKKGYVLRLHNIHPFFDSGCSVARRPGCGCLSSFSGGGTFSIRQCVSAHPTVMGPSRPFSVCRVSLSSRSTTTRWGQQRFCFRRRFLDHFDNEGQNLCKFFRRHD